MKVTLAYEPGSSRELAGGTVDLPPHLDFVFEWEEVIDDDARNYVVVNQEIVVAVAAEPVRMIAVMGTVRNSSSWEVVARLVGSEVFEAGEECVLRNQPDQIEVEIDLSVVDALRPIWDDLLTAGRDGTLKVLPRKPTDREEELFDLITSDPNFFIDGIRVLRILYGDEAVDNAFPDGEIK